MINTFFVSTTFSTIFSRHKLPKINYSFASRALSESADSTIIYRCTPSWKNRATWTASGPGVRRPFLVAWRRGAATRGERVRELWVGSWVEVPFLLGVRESNSLWFSKFACSPIQIQAIEVNKQARMHYATLCAAALGAHGISGWVSLQYL